MPKTGPFPHERHPPSPKRCPGSATRSRQPREPPGLAMRDTQSELFSSSLPSPGTLASAFINPSNMSGGIPNDIVNAVLKYPPKHPGILRANPNSISSLAGITRRQSGA
ncbi:hypothetical protein DPEC_G00294320 [Dallia pectoralis]|uniref:Uncharacterized protein n=1 Tax=Dallia pectoralis TaxID=75939 RepID=A0ACC2FIR2_DALPE|nr:hypothetical protein DPEC_G00294320 [Dallia pectoralis]